jgi:serine/threonine protein kinase
MSRDRGFLLREKLIAVGLGDLYDPLHELAGLTLAGCFRLREVFAVGGQSILWLADDLSQRDRLVLARMALLQYHRPAYIADEDIHRARQRIEREAQLLEQFKDTPLPRSYGLFYAPNPLQPAERGREVTDNEPFLVIELIQGPTVTESAKALAVGCSFCRKNARAALALETAHIVVELFCRLHDHGYLYTDLTPRNLIHASLPSDWPVRVLDAGSIIPSSPTPEIDVPFNWAYLPPDYYAAYRIVRNLWPTQGFVIYTLGKTLWQVLTGRQPMPGEQPDLEDSALLEQPPPLVDLVRGLVQGHYDGFGDLKAVVEDLRHDLSSILKKLWV